MNQLIDWLIDWLMFFRLIDWLIGFVVLIDWLLDWVDKIEPTFSKHGSSSSIIKSGSSRTILEKAMKDLRKNIITQAKSIFWTRLLLWMNKILTMKENRTEIRTSSGPPWDWPRSRTFGSGLPRLACSPAGVGSRGKSRTASRRPRWPAWRWTPVRPGCEAHWPRTPCQRSP